uniref:NADH-ubiquinone oxidoreductase chain 2 n=1 Tax=Perinereis aibuhitensis TaxID=126650 RepID=X2CTC1_PERAI|nr:NADH dehydrogenase subunit 2 [Perinereis aibuhitensis]AHA13386.1 NADH dehydrogenase subunit 2 [Perinereis aibuhitensis]
MTPSTFLFALTLISGTLISLSSTNWLYLWMGMELNLLSFIPLMATSQSLQETEASVKYFIIQAIGSGLMLTAGIMSINPMTLSNFHYLIPMIFFISMVIKLGMAPCHQWLPPVMSSISWIHCMILATWQKVSPLIMMMYIMPRNMFLMVSITAMLSALVGGMGGLNQTQLRALLAYSSIGHMGWMTATLECSSNLFIFYFSVYVVISIALMTILSNNNMMMSKIPNSIISLSPMSFFMVMVIIFSLGGLPPFLGFIPKWMIISELSSQLMFTLMLSLIAGSLINLFYYFNMTFNFILSLTQQPHFKAPPLWAGLLTVTSSLSSFLLIL